MAMNINQLTNIATNVQNTDKFYLGRSPFDTNSDFVITGVNLIAQMVNSNNAQTKGAVFQSTNSYTVPSMYASFTSYRVRMTNAGQAFTLPTGIPPGQVITVTNEDIGGTSQDFLLALADFNSGLSIGTIPVNCAVTLQVEEFVGGGIYYIPIRTSQKAVMTISSAVDYMMPYHASIVSFAFTAANKVLTMAPGSTIDAPIAGRPMIFINTGTNAVTLQNYSGTFVGTMQPGGTYLVSIGNNYALSGNPVFFKPLTQLNGDPLRATTSTSETLLATDVGGCVNYNGSSACLIGIPADTTLGINSSAAYTIQFKQSGSGSITPSPVAGSGVTLENGLMGTNSTQIASDISVWLHTATNTWTRID